MRYILEEDLMYVTIEGREYHVFEVYPFGYDGPSELIYSKVYTPEEVWEEVKHRFGYKPEDKYQGEIDPTIAERKFLRLFDENGKFMRKKAMEFLTIRPFPHFFSLKNTLGIFDHFALTSQDFKKYNFLEFSLRSYVYPDIKTQYKVSKYLDINLFFKLYYYNFFSFNKYLLQQLNKETKLKQSRIKRKYIKKRNTSKIPQNISNYNSLLFLDQNILNFSQLSKFKKQKKLLYFLQIKLNSLHEVYNINSFYSFIRKKNDFFISQFTHNLYQINISDYYENLFLLSKRMQKRRNINYQSLITNNNHHFFNVKRYLWSNKSNFFRTFLSVSSFNLSSSIFFKTNFNIIENISNFAIFSHIFFDHHWFSGILQKRKDKLVFRSRHWANYNSYSLIRYIRSFYTPNFKRVNYRVFLNDRGFKKLKFLFRMRFKKKKLHISRYFDVPFFVMRRFYYGKKKSEIRKRVLPLWQKTRKMVRSKKKNVIRMIKFYKENSVNTQNIYGVFDNFLNRKINQLTTNFIKYKNLNKKDFFFKKSLELKNIFYQHGTFDDPFLKFFYNAPNNFMYYAQRGKKIAFRLTGAKRQVIKKYKRERGRPKSFRLNLHRRKKFIYKYKKMGGFKNLKKSFYYNFFSKVTNIGDVSFCFKHKNNIYTIRYNFPELKKDGKFIDFFTSFKSKKILKFKKKWSPLFLHEYDFFVDYDIDAKNIIHIGVDFKNHLYRMSKADIDEIRRHYMLSKTSVESLIELKDSEVESNLDLKFSDYYPLDVLYFNEKESE